MARRGYPPEFRQRVIELVEGGRKVAEVAADLGISEQTIYVWRRQVLRSSGAAIVTTCSAPIERTAPSVPRRLTWTCGRKT
jgi:transposase-like protein